MKKRNFPSPKAGSWIQPSMMAYYMGCCDCGLVHKLQFRIVADGRTGRAPRLVVQFRAWRHQGYTRLLRKRRRIRVKTVT